MSHCAYYGDNYKECKGYPTYCDNRCLMYQQVSAQEVGDSLRKLIDKLEEGKNEIMD